METGIRTPIQMAVDSMRNLFLGYTGEANAQLIQIDVSKWTEKWPGASIDLMLSLPGEKASYPAKTELQDGKLLFLPGYGDTQKPGHGAAYVVATKDGTHMAASDTVLTEIMHKGRGGDELPEAPEAQAGWVADVLDAAHRAEEAAKRAENAQVTDEQVGKAVEDYLQENPVEAPVQSVNGQTGAVQLSAADVGALPEDTPIPAPYTLPTASADVKGGVKVGEGLEMVDGVMSVVPEPECDVIDTIILADDVLSGYCDEDTNGNKYNFSQLTVIVKFDTCTTAGSNLEPRIYYTDKDYVQCNVYISTGNNGVSIIEAKIENDILKLQGTQASFYNYVGSTVIKQPRIIKMNGKKIRKFWWNHRNLTGVTIEIWGVRD